MPHHVLFLCPHAAGKSVLAATYFRAAAVRLGVDATVAIAGTDPDDELMPSVRQALLDQGFVVDLAPQLVTAAAAQGADSIVSIGCVHAQVPTTKPIIEWDVPMLSDDFPAAMNAIHSRAEQLAAELA